MKIFKAVSLICAVKGASDCIKSDGSYYGSKMFARNGEKCQRWDITTCDAGKERYGSLWGWLFYPFCKFYELFKPIYFFTELPSPADHNYCRAVDSSVPWCYTSLEFENKEKSDWDYCTIPDCPVEYTVDTVPISAQWVRLLTCDGTDSEHNCAVSIEKGVTSTDGKATEEQNWLAATNEQTETYGIKLAIPLGGGLTAKLDASISEKISRETGVKNIMTSSTSEETIETITRSQSVPIEQGSVVTICQYRVVIAGGQVILSGEWKPIDGRDCSRLNDEESNSESYDEYQLEIDANFNETYHLNYTDSY